jgi:TIR domain
VRAWDVFISHASEDKAAVVLPLAGALERAGLRVWLDRQELRYGDVLHQKIDEGLANSRFGIVILSPSFFEKRWPEKELAGLFAAEDAAGRELIIPVWHGVDREQRVRYSPTLASRLGAKTEEGIPAIARHIVEIVTEPGSGGPSDVTPTPLRLLVALLDGPASRQQVVDFLAAHPKIAHAALNTARDSDQWSVMLGGTVVDLAASRTRATAGDVEWMLVQFVSPNEPLLGAGKTSGAMAERVAELRAVRRWIGGHLDVARATLAKITVSFDGIVVAGRRERLSEAEMEWLRRNNAEVPGVSVRTYDWLIDAAADLAKRQ